MKKLFSIISMLNLSIVPLTSIISCSTSDKKNNDRANPKDSNDSTEDEKDIENAIKSVDDILILTKLKGGIDSNGILTSNSTYADAIEFLQTEVQKTDLSASVVSNADDKLNSNLTVGDNTISVKFKKNEKNSGKTVNALITNVHDHEPRNNYIHEALIKSIFEESISGAHLLVANDYTDILPVINEKLYDVGEEIKVTLAKKQENQKLKGGNNTIEIKFIDKDNNEFILPINVKDVQNKAFTGKFKDEYPNNAVFKIANHTADEFGTQKVEQYHNLYAFDLFKTVISIVKSTGHHKIDETKYQQEYGNSSDEDLNETREVVKTSKKSTGFFNKTKDQLKFVKSKSSNSYAAPSYTNIKILEFPTIDTNDNKSEMLKINLLQKENDEENWQANHLIKPLFSKPINGKTLTTNDKVSAIMPMIKATLNTISGLHQWHYELSNKNQEQSILNKSTTIALVFTKSRSLSSVQFKIPVTVNQIRKMKKDSVDFSVLPKRIDADSWGLTTSSTWDHLRTNIIVSLKLNTNEFIIEPAMVTSKKYLKAKLSSKLTKQDNEKPLAWRITTKKNGGRGEIINITLFNIKPGKEKPTVFDNLYKKMGKNFGWFKK